MAQFGGYGFNKSHSAAYALLAYQTAYLKTHYPVEYFSALMTSESGDTDKIIRYIGVLPGEGDPDPPAGRERIAVRLLPLRPGDPLRPFRDQGARGFGDRRDPRGAQGEPLPLRPRPPLPGRPAEGEQAGGGEPDQVRGARLPRPGSRQGVRGSFRPSSRRRRRRSGGASPASSRSSGKRPEGSPPEAGAERGARGAFLVPPGAAHLREGDAGLLHHRAPDGLLRRGDRAVREHDAPAGSPR